MGWIIKNIRVVALTTALLVAAIIIWNVAGFQARSTDQAERAAVHYGHLTDERIAQNCTHLEPQRVLQCVTEQVRATREDQRSEYDLGAQERMARWALWAMLYAGVTATLSGVAVILLWATWKETRKVGRIANRSNVIAKRAFREQNRAYVFAVDAEIEWADRPFIKIALEISGLTPATNIAVKTTLTRGSVTGESPQKRRVVGLRDRCRPFDKNRAQWVDVGVGAEGRALLRSAAKDGLDVGVRGTVDYTCVTGETCTTTFLFKVAASDAHPIQKMKILPSPGAWLTIRPPKGEKP